MVGITKIITNKLYQYGKTTKLANNPSTICTQKLAQDGSKITRST
uniref:Uncharacterized protein n=1 Tax=Arundo donax TaxID=35708 RepID=A0A0A8Z9P0_ARUDO